jgi:predicted alpha/beta-fold hydrolase
MRSYRSPAWLPGGHAQTVWPVLFSRRPVLGGVRFSRERWSTPDGDFIDVDLCPAADRTAPWLVQFHGLEGSSESLYSQAFAAVAAERGWSFAVPHFRGCTAEMNLAPRAYHSGDYEEIGWILGQMRQRSTRPLLAVGVSMGGNALLRWAAEAGDTATRLASAVAAVCAPLDLAAGGAALGGGFNWWVYTRRFMRTLKPKALAKWAQYPGLFDRDRLLAARDLYEFDNAFTAPLHGFSSTEDYWKRAAALPHLPRIRLPALALNARNDPFVPQASLPRSGEVGAAVTLWQPKEGGHVGFPGGRFPGGIMAMPRAVAAWLGRSLSEQGDG